MGYTFLNFNLLISLAPLLVILIFLLLTLATASRIISGTFNNTGRKEHGLNLDESGTAIFEFVLAFPFFMATLLVIIQLILMINAKLVVNYAAFTATRSAIVGVPASTARETENFVFGSSSGERHGGKLDVIQNAAAFACIPISPRLSQLISSAGASASGFISSAFTDDGVFPQADGIDLVRIVDKAAYAQQFTEVRLIGGSGSKQFGEDEPITVEVTHDYHLNVPFAGALFAKRLGALLSPFGIHTIPITEKYTLVNQGQREVP